MTNPPSVPFPAELPDHRTAARLLDIVDQLQRALRQPRAASGAPTSSDELLQLQRENAQLKDRQAAAKAKLEALLARISTQPESTAESSAA